MRARDTRKRWPRIVAISLAAVVVLLAAGLLVVDSILLHKARAQAQELSREWGRPVELGGLSVTLFTGAGVRVTGLRIGAGPAEELPLLEVPRIEVKVALLRALFSGGKDIEVRSAEVSGLRANVVRLPDGTTNVERLQRRLAESRPQAPPPERRRAPGDLSFLRVGRAAISDARIAFVDRGASGPRSLSVDHLDAEVRGLRAGSPLDLVASAAVLSERRNFELRLHSAPLPLTLVPTPERLTLKVEPIDLAALAPFLPGSVGLRAGRFQADLDATLGAVVPGGGGPTRIKGVASATGLAFTGQQSARPLDVVLEADLEADAGPGDLKIGKFRVDFGPAGLVGKGSATGLASASPRVEGLEIVSHDLDPALLAAYFPSLRSLAARVSGPIGVSLRGSGTQAKPALELRVDLTPVRLAFPDALAKTAGAKAGLIAHLGGAGSGALHFDADADLAGVDLRPGDSLNKAPGDRLQIRLAGTRRAASHGQTIDLSRLELLLPGSDSATGKATIALAGAGERPQTRFEAELASDHLDLDHLLLPTTKTKKKSKSKPLDPKTFAGLSGQATARVGLVRVKKADLRDVLLQVRVQGDEVIVERGRLAAFGGEISADGTRLRLAHPDEPFHLAAQGKGIDVGSAVGLFAPQKIVSGRLDAKVNLTGGGETNADLSQTLAGVLDGDLRDGAFHGKDLIAGVTSPLAKALPFGLAGKVPKGGGATALGKDLPFTLRFRNGVAQLDKPIQVSRPEANVSIGGGFRLDGSLDLAGTVALAPQTIASITGGRVRPQGPIPVTYRLTGPASSPALQDIGLAPAVQAIVKEAGAAVLGKALGAPGTPPQEATQKGEDEAQRQAQEARKRAEEEAKKRLEGLFH
jgi:AsmA protein